MPLSTPHAKPPDYYCTHAPVLRALPRVGAAWEAGAGWHSTPVLAAMCDTFRSWDESEDWARSLTLAAQGAYVVQHATPNIQSVISEALQHSIPDLLFIDCGTAGVARTQGRGIVAAMALGAGIKYVVLHDTEPHVLTVYGWQEAFRLAKYRLDWPGTWYGVKQPDGRPVPWTTVLSMTDDLADVRHNLRGPA